jgi:hypothetical protein
MSFLHSAAESHPCRERIAPHSSWSDFDALGLVPARYELSSDLWMDLSRFEPEFHTTFKLACKHRQGGHWALPLSQMTGMMPAG